MRGQDRRSRQAWEQTRVLAGLVHKLLTDKDLKMDLPWDDEDETQMSPEELKDMQAKARAMEDWMNRRGGNL